VQPQPDGLILLAEPKPVRGVKLKHVSAFTMLLSVLCLCAFLIGRVDAVAAGKTQQGQKVRRRQPAESGISQAQQYVAESSQLRTRLRISS
jgi:hypothetical protein